MILILLLLHARSRSLVGKTDRTIWDRTCRFRRSLCYNQKPQMGYMLPVHDSVRHKYICFCFCRVVVQSAKLPPPYTHERHHRSIVHAGLTRSNLAPPAPTATNGRNSRQALQQFWVHPNYSVVRSCPYDLALEDITKSSTK